MGYKMIEIDEAKLDKMAEYTEDALHSMGRLMSCIESATRGSMGERDDEDYNRYGNRKGSSGGRMGYRDDDDDDDWDEDDEMMGERRGRRKRDSMGRYR